LIEFRELFGRLSDCQLMREHTGQTGSHGRLLFVLSQVLPRVFFTEMKFLRLALGELGDMEGGGLSALLTLHRSFPNNCPSGPPQTRTAVLAAISMRLLPQSQTAVPPQNGTAVSRAAVPIADRLFGQLYVGKGKPEGF
jgi:hypothetical protein